MAYLPEPRPGQLEPSAQLGVARALPAEPNDLGVALPVMLGIGLAGRRAERAAGPAQDHPDARRCAHDRAAAAIRACADALVRLLQEGLLALPAEM
jgi:hypothetical protein